MYQPTLGQIARALSGQVSGRQVLAPGPGHSLRDRSLSVRLSHQSPLGFICFSHAGDPFDVCRDYVAGRLGLPVNAWRDQVTAARRAAIEIGSDDAARTARAVAIWDEGHHPRGTVVETYLANRGLVLDDVVAGAAIRFHPGCPWNDKATGELLRVPCMLAAMRQIDSDRIVAVHRTRLTLDGVKLERRMLGPAAGAAMKLDPDEAVSLGLVVGEGVETVLSARAIGFRPAWALGSAAAVAKLPVLPGVEALTILVEIDAANERATEEIGERWHAARGDVILVRPRVGNDLNDALRLRKVA